MPSTLLFDETHHGTRITLGVERNDDGHLVIAGHDVGAAPRSIFERDDYEYWYTFTAQAEDRLRTALGTALGTAATDDSTAEDVLRHAFRTHLLATPTDVRPYLQEHSFPYGFHSF